MTILSCYKNLRFKTGLSQNKTKIKTFCEYGPWSLSVRRQKMEGVEDNGRTMKDSTKNMDELTINGYSPLQFIAVCAALALHRRLEQFVFSFGKMTFVHFCLIMYVIS